MKKIHIIYLFSIYINILNAQIVYVYDNQTKNPVPFANVTFLQDESITDATYCNEYGFVNIKTDKKFDRIEFSCIGYVSKSITNTSKNDTIFLVKKVITLDEVVISKKDFPFSVLGYTKNKKKIKLSASKGFQLCVYIDNPYKEVKQIKSFLFKVKRRENYKTAIRIHFYKKQPNNNEPGEEILNEDIVRYFDGKTKELVEIDVTKYWIEFPVEGAFVGIEWLGIVDEKTGEFIENKEKWSDTSIELNDASNKTLTFIKNATKKNTWSNTEQLGKDLGLKNYLNASFGIKVYD